MSLPDGQGRKEISQTSSGHIQDGKKILERLNVGDTKAIIEALEQIHWSSIEEARQNVQGNTDTRKTFKEVLRNSEHIKDRKGPKEASARENQGDWIRVTQKKKRSQKQMGRDREATIIFLHVIPEMTTGKEI